MSKGGKPQSKAVELISNILSIFDQQSGELGVNQIARNLDVYPSKIHRIVSALEANGLLEKNLATKKYRIGLRFFETGMLYSYHSELRKIVHPHAVNLAEKFKSNVNLAILSRMNLGTAVIIDRVAMPRADIPARGVMYNVSIHNSSLGKCLLAFSNNEFRRFILSQTKFKKRTQTTIIDKKLFEDELELIQKRGYATNRGEDYQNLWGIAAPIRGASGLLGALGTSDTAQKIQENEEEMVHVIIETTSFISRQLGFEY